MAYLHVCDRIKEENKRVAEHMLEHWGVDRGSMLTGSSDMHQSVTKVFYRLFYYLEETKLLDPTNNIHIYSLHYVYVPRINLRLILFRNAWNKHGLRTEHALTPEQLFVAGALQLRNSRMVALDFFDNIQSNNYGVVEEGLEVDDNDDDAVVVP